VTDFILLKLGMTLKQVILHLDVPLDIANISLCITLCLLFVFIDLSLKAVLNAFLECSNLFLAIFADSLKLSL
jgi:hypothetical protein